MEKEPEHIISTLYDKVYSTGTQVFGLGKPEEIVMAAARLLPPHGKVIELGAGQGRNSLALAEQGFQVLALDISPIGVEFMTQTAEKKSLNYFEAKIADVRDNIKGQYDLVVSTLMLHHLSIDEAYKVFRTISELTNDLGLNAITVFTSEGDFAKKSKNMGYFYPTSSELHQIYSEWEILDYEEVRNEARAINSDGTRTFNTKANILARKPKSLLVS